MTEVSPNSYHASFYSVYFLLRRFATAILLVVLVKWPFFTCTFLMIFSYMNFIYLTIVRPLETKKANIIESFNEICIYFCSHIYTVLCRAEGGHVFIDKMGWVYMSICSFNVLSNIVLILLGKFAILLSLYSNKNSRCIKITMFQVSRFLSA